MPIRTGLDERIKDVRAELKEYFAEAKQHIPKQLRLLLNSIRKCIKK